MDDIGKEEDTSLGVATLSRGARSILSQALQDVRSSVAQLHSAEVSPLEALDSMAVDALKELYYTINTEDPMNAMPARRLVLEQRTVRMALLPLVKAVHSDPTAETNRKRWSVPMYQTLRLLSVLSIPISVENQTVKLGSSLDSQLLKLRADLAQDRAAVHSFVALLQYYIERKAEKQADLAVAEASKVEDARIDNILRFFRNCLSPPRLNVGEDVTARDRGVHLALVGALVHADFYSTIAILFSSKEDAHGQYSDIVFLVADIYAQTYRHTSPQQLYHCFRHNRAALPSIIKNDERGSEPKTAIKKSVFDDDYVMPTLKLGASTTIEKRPNASINSSRIRAALQRERSFVGGTRVIRASARWTSRHSGGFQASKKPNAGSQAGGIGVEGDGNDESRNKSSTSGIINKKVVSARNAIQSKLSLNPLRPFQENFQINSDILCMLAAKGRFIAMKRQVTKSKLKELMRKDLQEDGLKGIVALTTEMVDTCFEHMITELRSQIEELKSRSLGEDNEVLITAQNSFLGILGSVVGFQREKYGKVFKNNSHPGRSLSAEIHQNCMKTILSSDFKIAKTEWLAVRAGIELESFQLVFRILVDSCESLKKSGKDDKKTALIETSTFAVLEMTKMLQGMAANFEDDSEKLKEQDTDLTSDDAKKKASLTSREIALNTLEELFEQHEFLNAPADLAKDYTTKLYSYRHLTNIVEITHAFTTILLDEEELARLRVSKSKRGRKAAAKKERKSKDVDISSHSDKAVTAVVSSENADGVDGHAHDPTKVPVEGTEGNSDQRLESVESAESAGKPSIEKEQEKEESNSQGHVEGKDVEQEGMKDETNDKGLEGGTDSSEDPATAEGEVRIAQEKDNLGEDPGVEDDESFEPELREVESVGIIRRFANYRALQTLLLPIRAAICHASSLTGAIHNIPDGAGPIVSNIIVAKAAHALAAIWKVAKSRERGAMCGQFFTYGTMHLISITLEAMDRGSVLEHSILHSFAVLARDITQVFFSWLTLSPGLTLDMFFSMDKGSCQTYSTSIGHRTAMLEQQKQAAETGKADSGNDSDVSDLAIDRRRGNIDFEHIEMRASERSARKQRTSRRFREKMAEIRRSERVRIEEDEDVDVDDIDIGGGMETSGDDSDAGSKENGNATNGDGAEKKFCRMSRKKRKRQSSAQALSDGRDVKRPVKKPRFKKSAKRNKTLGSAKPMEFGSSDEYRAVDSVSDSSDEERAGKVAVSTPLVSSEKPISRGSVQKESVATPSTAPGLRKRRVLMSDSESDAGSSSSEDERPLRPFKKTKLDQAPKSVGAAEIDQAVRPGKAAEVDQAPRLVQVAEGDEVLEAAKDTPNNRSIETKRRRLVLSDSESD